MSSAWGKYITHGELIHSRDVNSENNHYYVSPKLKCWLLKQFVENKSLIPWTHQTSLSVATNCNQ